MLKSLWDKNLSAAFKETNLELHSEYKAARKLVNPASAPKEKTQKKSKATPKTDTDTSSEKEEAAVAKPEASTEKPKSEISSDKSKVA